MDQTQNSARQPAEKSTATHVAKVLLSTGCVMFAGYGEDPFTLTSGKKSPVYVDCRRLISYPAERALVMRLGRLHLIKALDIENSIDYIAGGETAGIPYAAWLAEALHKPMIYVRKEAKGFGRMAQIEGYLPKGEEPRVLLVEDMATDGGSKIVFTDALRTAGTQINHVFCPFYYDVFAHSEELLQNAHLTLHYLATWADILDVAEKQALFPEEILASTRRFLDSPDDWQREYGT